MQRLCEPHDVPPEPSSDRTVPVCTTFGYLPPENAQAVLEQLKTSRPFFGPSEDGEAKAMRYEGWLRSQVGEGLERYLVLLEHVVEFSRRARRFSKLAREGAEAERERERGEGMVA